MPRDLLISELRARTAEHDHVAQLICLIFDILDEQDQYRRMLTKSNIVEVIRDYHAMQREQSTEPGPKALRFETGDRERILHHTLEHVKRTVLQSYVDRHVLKTESVNKHLRAVRAMLEDLSQDSVQSWYTYYAREFNGLSYDQYRKAGRARFEYFMGLAKRDFLARCQAYFSP